MIDPRHVERIASSLDANTKAVNNLANQVALAREKGINVTVQIENTDYPINVNANIREMKK